MHRFQRLFGALVALLAVAATDPGVAAAQEIDSASSDTLVRALGLPEVTVAVGPDGVRAPADLPTGPHVVTLRAEAEFVGYLNVVRMPDGLSDEERQRQAYAAGVEDMPQPGWTYFGGTNTFGPGEPATFVVDLDSGDYHWAASYYVPNQDLPEGQPFEETFHFAPLTVGEAAGGAGEATPAPVVGAEVPATVRLEMTDELRYLVSPDPVPAGPQIWEIVNTGQHHAHHVVMMRVPDGTTAERIVGEFTSLMSGSPPAGEPLMAQTVGVAYAALQSGGATTWVELDLGPATYAVVCFILDPATGQPHLTSGMATVFEVA
ncbi:MAG: hypothetical protein M3Q10_03350 [Chloroflexota bacterium]|nr:hypothetical protein [Chloroflexota bacterium]